MKKYLLLILIAISAITLYLTTSVNKSIIIDVAYNDLTLEARQQVDCLAENVYKEAGHEPEDGRNAVALVTINRTQDPRVPSSICSVVKQKTKQTCQFSWFCMKHIKMDKTSEAYKASLKAALFVYANYEKIHDITQGALYYHADYVNPRWRGLVKTTQIGRHIFYKEL